MGICAWQWSVKEDLLLVLSESDIPSVHSLWGNNILWEFSRAGRMPEAQRWCPGQGREDAQRVGVYDIQRMNSMISLEKYSGVRMIVAQVQWLYPLGISPLP